MKMKEFIMEPSLKLIAILKSFLMVYKVCHSDIA